jgi:hypothetical protein
VALTDEPLSSLVLFRDGINLKPVHLLLHLLLLLLLLRHRS